jgi:hypothetical protein
MSCARRDCRAAAAGAEVGGALVCRGWAAEVCVPPTAEASAVAIGSGSNDIPTMAWASTLPLKRESGWQRVVTKDTPTIGWAGGVLLGL